MAKELYVGHLSEQTTEEDLRRLFSVMGVVTSVHLIIDPETREFKRCGYVRMAAGVDPAEVAETLDGAYLIDREIHVSIARPQKPGMAGKSAPYKPWMKDRPKPADKSGGQGKGRPQTKSAPPATPDGKAPSSAKPAAKPATKPATPAGRPVKSGRGTPSAGGSTPRPRRKP